MGHAEVAKAPAQTGNDILRGSEEVEEALRQLGIRRALTLTHQRQRENRRQQQGSQHDKPLEEVRPAHGGEAAKEGIGNDNEGRQVHGNGGVDVHDRVEQGAAGLDGGSGIDGVGHKENRRAQHLQHLAPGQEPVGQVLGDSDGILGRDGKPAQPGSHENPAQGVADAKTDGNPGLTDAEGVDGGRQAHEHPGAHIRRAGRQGGYPRAHIPAAQEVVLFTGALGLYKEVQADAQHENKIGREDQHFHNVHKVPSLFLT